MLQSAPSTFSCERPLGKRKLTVLALDATVRNRPQAVIDKIASKLDRQDFVHKFCTGSSPLRLNANDHKIDCLSEATVCN